MSKQQLQHLLSNVCSLSLMLWLQTPAQDTGKEMAWDKFRRNREYGNDSVKGLRVWGEFWVHFERRKQKRKRELSTYIQTGKKGFNFYLLFSFPKQTQQQQQHCSVIFHHIWFVHSGIQGVSAAQLNHTFLLPDTPLSFKFSAGQS